ncbi:MLX-interacting protein-like [Oppia nitens]|uniref:MLX-interacting protein-like n=1 Tax=Oppia nitens TaxID=1686743 RepID=UPI0023DA5EB4|nr:MLX-interacting protein-like [Oppia nitens]
MPSMATMMSRFGFHDIMQPSVGHQNSAQIAISDTSSGDTMSPQRKISRETIHSGHFMVSEIDENEQTGGVVVAEPSHDSDYERPVETNDALNYDLEMNCRETTQTYAYGPKSLNTVSIDGSLTKLFECMSLAYSGKITSPRWKTFKGLKLKLKDKIRLNNIIWRAWHIQYIARRNPIVCQFSSPVDSDRHKKAEAVIMEGKYWKRRLATVTAEYQKWRQYYRNTGRPVTPSRPAIQFDWENSFNTLSADMVSADDIMDFSDTFLSNLPINFDFPNPREIARSGMSAEFIQPGLVQLQPNFDEFMDTFEPYQELFFNSKNTSSLPTLPEESNVVADQQNSKQLNHLISDLSAKDLMIQLLGESNNMTANTNATSIQNYTVNNKNLMQTMDSIQNQFDPNLNASYKMNSMNTIQPQVVSNAQTMPVMTNMTAIQNNMQSKPLLDQTIPYTQYGSPVGGTQNTVPLTHIQSPIHTKSRVQMVQEFAQSNNNNNINNNINNNSISYSSMTVSPVSPAHQHYVNVKTSQSPLRKKYQNTHPKVTIASSAATNQKFAIPKTMPAKQRSRERSISTPHINRGGLQVLPPVTTQASAVSMLDINSLPNPNPRVNQIPIERSNSLPVYTQEPQRRKGVVALPPNMFNTSNLVTTSTTNLSPNLSYSLQPTIQSIQHQQQQQPTTINNHRLQIITQNDANNSYSSSPYLSSQQQLVVSNMPNAYDIPQGSTNTTSSSNDSTLIARLLTSNSLSNISGNSSSQQQQQHQQHMYSNQSAAHNMNARNTERPTTIDASCIGIRPQVKTIANEKSQMFLPKQMSDTNTTAIQMSGQLTPNFKPNFIIQSNQDISSSSSIVSIVPHMPSLSKSHSSPISLHSSKDKFTGFQSIPSPPSMCSPTNAPKGKPGKDKVQYREHRRVCHINAEQKRRCNIKNGFDTLKTLLPSISHNTNTKISKAAMLQKAVEFIQELQGESHKQQDETDQLRNQVDSVNQIISVYQNQLPATGVPISSQRSSQTRVLYENYVREKTLENWKFWIFSIIMGSLWDSYNQTVTTSSDEEITKSLSRWLEHSCCLSQLRKDVCNSLRYLSTSTNILTDPNLLPDEAYQAVTKKEKQLSS